MSYLVGNKKITDTTELVPPGRYYLHIKRVDLLDIAPIEVTVILVARQCVDQQDNDLDGLVDLDDPGCVDADGTENTDSIQYHACLF